MAYGFTVPAGYMGRLADGTFQLFETESAYLEHLADN